MNRQSITLLSIRSATRNVVVDKGDATLAVDFSATTIGPSANVFPSLITQTRDVHRQACGCLNVQLGGVGAARCLTDTHEETKVWISRAAAQLGGAFLFSQGV